MAPLVSTTAALPQTIADDRAAALHTKAVYLVFTSLLETPPAAGVAIELAHALGVPLIVVEFRAGRLPAQPDDAT